MKSSVGPGLAITTGWEVIAVDGDGNVPIKLWSLATVWGNPHDHFILVVEDSGSLRHSGDQPGSTGACLSLVLVATARDCHGIVERYIAEDPDIVGTAEAGSRMIIIIFRCESGNDRCAATGKIPVGNRRSS